MRIWGLVFLAACSSAAWAGGRPILDGPEILSELAGKTIRGAYADGTAFTETLWPDGKDTYWDPRGASVGHWSVERDLVCFKYDDEYNMAGGCFRVEKNGSNCFDFYSEKEAVGDTAKPAKKRRYVARASSDGAEATCPVDLQV